MSPPVATLATCSTWFFRWNAAAAAPRRPVGATPARPSSRSALTSHTWSPAHPSAACRSSRSAVTQVPAATRSWRSKEHGRADLITPLGNALAIGVHRLLTWGMVDTPLTLVPAPTRLSAARRRGGDPVTRIAAVAAARAPGHHGRSGTANEGVGPDSVGLGSAARERNIAGRVRSAGPGRGCPRCRSGAGRRHRHHRRHGARIRPASCSLRGPTAAVLAIAAA